MLGDDLSVLHGFDVVILGEVHDNPDHHAFQARAVAEIAPAALVFEMFGPDAASRVAGGVRGDSAALEDALGWAESGWPDFAMYHPIFLATDAPVYGAALPRSDVRRALTEGAAAVFGPGADRFGLAEPLPEADQAAREAEQMASHCDALPEDMLAGMVEAQRLRDAAFARTVIEAFEATGGPVAVITGSGHARLDQGIPAALATAAPGLRVVSVGAFEGEVPGDTPFDYAVTAPAPEREDPCAVFRQ